MTQSDSRQGTLTGPFLDPIKLHVDGLGYFLFYGVIVKTLGSELLYLNFCRSLFMTKFPNTGTNGNVFLAIDVGRSYLGL